MNLRKRINSLNLSIGSASNSGDVAENLGKLSQKLDAIVKNYTVWDYYNIVKVADSTTVLSEEINSLTPGSSMVINNNFGSYHKGDIIVKDITGKQHHLLMESSGVYIPSLTKNSDGTLDVKYEYADTSDAVVETTGILISNSSSTLAYTDNFTTPTSRVEFDAKNGLYPVIKMYTEDGELVEAEIHLTLDDDGKYTITNIPSIVSVLQVR